VRPKKVLRSLYFDPDVDQMLGAWADREGTSKADLIRNLIEDGLHKAATPKPTVENTILATLQRIDEKLTELNDSVSGLAKSAGPRARAGGPADEVVELPLIDDDLDDELEGLLADEKRTGKLKDHPAARQLNPRRAAKREDVKR